MPAGIPFNTCYVEPDGVDLGREILEKDFLLDTYPGLIPSLKTTTVNAAGKGVCFVLGTGSTTTASAGTVPQFVTAPNWCQIRSNWYHPDAGWGDSFQGLAAAGVKTDGTLWTWGNGSAGILGDGTTITKSSPVQTLSGGNNWLKVAVSHHHANYPERHSMAGIKCDGTLWVWGQNCRGELGDGTTIFKCSPIQTLSGGTNWKEISIGTRFMAAIKTDGTLWTWGINYASGRGGGQLGNGDTLDRSSPVQTSAGGTNWRFVATGDLHALAIKTDGTLWGWGDNNYNQTTIGGNGSNPVQIGSSTNWCHAAGYAASSFGITTDGRFWSWGCNLNATLPIGSTWGQDYLDQACRFSSPVQVLGSTLGWSKVFNNQTALKVDGTLWCWNKATNGSPVQFVTGSKGWISSCGHFQIRDNELLCSELSGFKFCHNGLGVVDFDDVYVRKCCFSDAAVWTWGCNRRGQLGDGTTIDKSSPVQIISGGTNWKTVSTGCEFSAGIKQDGSLWLWGCNNNGQLGDGTTINKSSPVQTISQGTNWKCIELSDHAMAIKNDGSLWLWGRNFCGKLGDGTTVDKCSPVQTISQGQNWSRIAASVQSAAIKSDGTLWLWGYGGCGVLGNNATTSRSSPIQTVSQGSNWCQVSVGYHSAAVKTDGTLWLWGANRCGILGANGFLFGTSSPIQTISQGSNWCQVSVGFEHTAAVKTDGTLWLWGSQECGRLGNNANSALIGLSSPVQTISQGTNWKSVCLPKGGLGNFTIATKTDGTLWMWGNGGSGQLGNNTTVCHSSPIQTIVSTNDWSRISSGFNSSVALRFGTFGS